MRGRFKHSGNQGLRTCPANGRGLRAIAGIVRLFDADCLCLNMCIIIELIPDQEMCVHPLLYGGFLGYCMGPQTERDIIL